MANGFNATNFGAALKRRYSKDFVETMVYQGKPLFALMKKMEDMGGESFSQPVLFEDPTSRSATFSTAQTQSTSAYSRAKVFAVTRVEDFGVVTVKGQHIKASKGHENAFFDFVTTAIDGIMRATARSAAIGLYRKGWGAIGQVSSPTASTTLTLTNRQDIVNFAVGMKVQYSASEDSAALLDSGEEQTVVSVDRNAGTMVMSAVVTGIASIADGAYIFASGDREDSATPTRLKIAGLEDWCPQTAPTSTSFFGVDRTTDTRLGGCRYDGSGVPIEEALIEGGIRCQAEGGQPDHVFMNPTKFGDLVKSLGSKVQFVDLKAGTAGIGFRALELHTSIGTLKIVPDRDCPVNRAFMLQMDTWMLGSLGSVPQILNHDGLESLRQASDDGIEIRVGYYGNAIGKAPGWNCNIKL